MSASGWAGRFAFVLGVYAWAGVMFAQSLSDLDVPVRGAWGSEVTVCQFLEVAVNVSESPLAVYCSESVKALNVSVPEYITSAADFISIFSTAMDLCVYPARGFLIAAHKSDTLCNAHFGGGVSAPEYRDLFGVSLGSLAGSPADEVTGSDASPVLQEPLGGTTLRNDNFIIRFDIISMQKNNSLGLGVNWDNPLDTLAGLYLGYQFALDGFLPSAEFQKLISFIERDSLGSRSDFLDVRTSNKQTAQYNRGGSLNVSLVGAGAANIERSFNYGLIVSVTPERVGDNVALSYTYEDIDPSNIQDVSLISLSQTSSSSSVVVPCDSSIILSTFGSARHDASGSGLPGLARVPVAGYAFGQSSEGLTSVIYSVAVTVQCL